MISHFEKIPLPTQYIGVCSRFLSILLIISCLSNELGSTQQRRRHTPSIIVTDNWCYMLSWQTNLNCPIIYAFIDSITNDLLLYAAINTPRLSCSIVNHILFRHHCNVFTTGACLTFSLNPSTYNKYYFVLYEFFYDTDKLDEGKRQRQKKKKINDMVN